MALDTTAAQQELVNAIENLAAKIRGGFLRSEDSVNSAKAAKDYAEAIEILQNLK